MKSNDKIPADEMLLAEAIAAAKARGLSWCSTYPFAHGPIGAYTARGATACCALGALSLAGHVQMRTIKAMCRRDSEHPFADVWRGNDFSDVEYSEGPDQGESLGWAFRCFMTQEES